MTVGKSPVCNPAGFTSMSLVQGGASNATERFQYSNGPWRHIETRCPTLHLNASRTSDSAQISSTLMHSKHLVVDDLVTRTPHYVFVCLFSIYTIRKNERTLGFSTRSKACGRRGQPSSVFSSRCALQVDRVQSHPSGADLCLCTTWHHQG